MKKGESIATVQPLNPVAQPKKVRVIVEFDGVPVWERWQQDNGRCGGLATTDTPTLNLITTSLQESIQQANSLKHE